jgi:hypothetical protein
MLCFPFFIDQQLKTDCKRNGMKINSDQKKLVELFIKQEVLIGSLYKLFADRYPDYKVFWTEMAKEEHQHATCIRRLIERDSTDALKFSHGELRASDLAASIKSIEGLISGFNSNKEFPVTQAVSLALHLEKALWEKKVFQYFEGDSDEVREIMDTLNLEQKIHVKKIGKFAWQLQKKTLNENNPS